MTDETDMNTMISANISTNSMHPKITPEILRDTLLSLNSKVVCKDNSSWVVAAMQSIIDAMSSNITNLQNNKASTTSVTNLGDALTILINGKADKTYVDTELGKRPTVYYGNVQKSNAKFWVGSAVVSGGNAVFNMVDGSGNAWFTNVYLESIQPVLRNSNSPPAFGSPSVSTDKKTLTLPTNKAAAGIVVLSISLLGAVVVANGDTVTVMVLGD